MLDIPSTCLLLKSQPALNPYARMPLILRVPSICLHVYSRTPRSVRQLRESIITGGYVAKGGGTAGSQLGTWAEDEGDEVNYSNTTREDAVLVFSELEDARELLKQIHTAIHVVDTRCERMRAAICPGS